MCLEHGGISQSLISASDSLEDAAFLGVMLFMRTRKMQLGRLSVPEWILNNKLRAYDLIDALNFRRPRVIRACAEMDSIQPRGGIVVKPYQGFGSRRVYLAFKKNHIYKIKTGEIIGDWEGMRKSVAEDVAAVAVNEDRWIVEN